MSAQQQILIGLGGGSGLSDWQTEVNALSPLGWYRLGEPSGVSVNSGSTPSADMTQVNTLSRNVAGLITGDSNGAASNASNGHFSVTMPSAFNRNRDWTYAAWIEFTSTSLTQPIIVGGAYFRVSPAQKLEFFDFPTGTLIAYSTTTLSVSTRYFVALTVGTGTTATYTFYVDGVSDGSGTTSASFSGSTFWTFWDTFNSFRGKIDEALFFDYALSGTQVLDLYNAGA